MFIDKIKNLFKHKQKEESQEQMSQKKEENKVEVDDRYQTTRTEIRLVDAGNNKIAVIKVIKDATGLDLTEVKNIVDNNEIIKTNCSEEDVKSMVSQLQDLGATVEFK